MKFILDFYDMDGNLTSMMPIEKRYPNIKTDENKIEFFNELLNNTKVVINEYKENSPFTNLIEKENEFSFDMIAGLKRHIICKLEEE